VIRRNLESYRSRVTFDPFDSVIVGDAATRARLKERVLWEDDSVIVIVAKPALPRDALVIPKREMMFPVDASEALLARLARVAGATSDAFIQTAGLQCKSAFTSSISISPPGSIGVRHLHVHVQPPDSIVIENEQDFYNRMSRNLNQILSTTTGSSTPPLQERLEWLDRGISSVFAADSTPDAYFVYDLQAADLPSGAGPILSSFTVDKAHLTMVRLGLHLETELNGIALVPLGSPVLAPAG